MASRWIQRTLLTGGSAAFALSALACSALAQQSADPYQGVAHPPSDAILTNESAPAPTYAKPSAATLLASPASSVAQHAAAISAPASQPTAQTAMPVRAAADPDGDIVHPEAATDTATAAPAPLATRAAAVADPDGDIVHPSEARPGEIAEGTMFQMELLDRLTSTDNEKGDSFHGKVLADVMQNGKVLIPAGSVVEGRISAISSGHLAGHGSMRLTPQTLILPDSTRLALSAEVSGTPGTHNRIDDEGGITPGPRKERAGLEYGAVAGAGAATGAVFAGPVGALAGGLVGAGMVTTHLVVSHPQVNLDPGTKVLFTLTAPLNLIPSTRTAQ